jgi:hypothetical protein
MSKTLWESEGKTPNGKPFFAVKQARNYYFYGERGGIDSIFFILYDKHDEIWALIEESKPPRDEQENSKVMMTTAFGGSIDMDGKNPKEICQIEVLEESGYNVPMDRITYMGETLVSTQMSQMAKGYFVDVTDISKTQKAEYEIDVSESQNIKDPDEFSRNSVKWLSTSEVIENSDWKSIFIVTKAIFEELV